MRGIFKRVTALLLCMFITSGAALFLSDTQVFAAETYNIWIGSTQITETNKNDVLGDGTVSYDSDANILTFNNFVYDELMGSYDDSAVYIQIDKMKIKGNAIIVSAINNSGIRFHPDVSAVFEDADLDITATYGAISSGKVITISGGNYNLVSTLNSAIEYFKKLVITGGNIYAKGSCFGVYAYSYAMNMTGGSLLAVGSSSAYDAICVSDLDVSGGRLEAIGQKGANAIRTTGGSDHLTLGSNMDYALNEEDHKIITSKVDNATITVTNDGNGSASADPTSGSTGTEVTLTAEPNTGYEFDEWQVISGTVVIADKTSATTTFNIESDDVEVKAVFKAIPTYTVTLNISTFDKDGNPITDVGGTATVSKNSGVTGDKITVTATPNEGYELESITYGDGGVFTDITTTKEFDIDAYDVVVDVSFKAVDTGSSGGSTTTDPATGTTGGSTTTDPDTGSSGGSTTTDPATGTAGDSTTTDPDTGSSGGSTTTDPATGTTGDSTTTDPASGTSSDASGSNSGATMDPSAPTYKVIQGAEATVDGTTDYVVEVERSIDDEHCLSYFDWVAIDGIKLTEEQAPSSSGSTVITIKSDYLKTLSEGKHTIVVNFVDNSISTTFTLQSAAQKSGANIPSTGELQSPAMYIGIALIAAACGVTGIVVAKKRKEEA